MKLKEDAKKVEDSIEETLTLSLIHIFWTGVPSLRNPPDLHTRPVLPAACFYSAAAH